MYQDKFDGARPGYRENNFALGQRDLIFIK